MNRAVVAVGGLGALLLGALLLRFPPDRYQLYLCPFRAATGLLCPGCGGTRAVMALLHGDWRAAWHWNPLVLSLVPFGLIYLVGMLRRLAQHRDPWVQLPGAVWVVLATATVAFDVMRNLPGWG